MAVKLLQRVVDHNHTPHPGIEKLEDEFQCHGHESGTVNKVDGPNPQGKVILQIKISYNYFLLKSMCEFCLLARTWKGI